jgi:hypothetical protein
MLGSAPSVVGQCRSSKRLPLRRSSSVLHRPGMPSLHEASTDITKLWRASARYLSLCLPVQSIPCPRPPSSSLPHYISAVSNPSSLPVRCCALLRLPVTPLHLLSAQLNLHSARVRRNPSGFLQVAVSNARNPTVPHVRILPTRASDTALRLLSRNSFRSDDSGTVAQSRST